MNMALSLKEPSREVSQGISELLVSCVENGIEKYGSSVKFVVYHRFRQEHGLEISSVAERPDLFASTIDKFFGVQGEAVRSCIGREIQNAIERLESTNSDEAALLKSAREHFRPVKQDISASEPVVEAFSDYGRMSLVLREPAFFLILRESVLAGLAKVLGEDGVQSTFYHLELATCIEKPVQFHRRLHSMYRAGTIPLEKAILIELFKKLHTTFRERKGFEYPDYVNEAGRVFQAQSR